VNLWPETVTLRGAHAELVPLCPGHHDDLVEAVKDGELWQLWYTAVPEPGAMGQEIARRLGLRERGMMLPFTVVDGEGRIRGMTSYMNIDEVNRRVEIGSTWLARSAQRSVLNSACKRLLLGHAFEVLDCIAVEFRTHFFNHDSRRAIERLGAKQDGILRSHQIGANGALRDTVVFSIVAQEWPAVKTHLDARISALCPGGREAPGESRR